MIVRTEREVEQEGVTALNLNQSCDRFHEQLSFRTVYKNQFKIQKLEKLINENQDETLQNVFGKIDGLKDTDF